MAVDRGAAAVEKKRRDGRKGLLPALPSSTWMRGRLFPEGLSQKYFCSSPTSAVKNGDLYCDRQAWAGDM